MCSPPFITCAELQQEYATITFAFLFLDVEQMEAHPLNFIWAMNRRTSHSQD